MWRQLPVTPKLNLAKRTPPLCLARIWQLYDHMTIGSNAYLRRPANMSFAEYEAYMQANGPYGYGYGCDSLDNNEVRGHGERDPLRSRAPSQRAPSLLMLALLYVPPPGRECG